MGRYFLAALVATHAGKEHYPIPVVIRFLPMANQDENQQKNFDNHPRIIEKIRIFILRNFHEEFGFYQISRVSRLMSKMTANSIWQIDQWKSGINLCTFLWLLMYFRDFGRIAGFQLHCRNWSSVGRLEFMKVLLILQWIVCFEIIKCQILLGNVNVRVLNKSFVQ